MQPPGTTRKLSFQTVLRTVVAVQLVGTLAIVAFLLASTVVTSTNTDSLQQLSTGAAEARNIRDLFVTSDLSLQKYIEEAKAGDGTFDALQGYASSRVAMPILVGRARSALGGNVSRDIGAWYREYVPYAAKYREPILELIVDDPPRPDKAERLLMGAAGREGYASLLEGAGTNTLTAISRREAAKDRVERLQLISLLIAAAVGVGLVVFDIALFLYTRREFVRPLSDLATSARKIGHGDFSRRAAGSNVSEIDVVASSFNNMADELARRMDELRQATLDRTQFVSSVSHELRTPATSLRGYLEMLSSGEAGDLLPEQQRYVEIAERNARQLDELISDLLTLSRLEHGSVKLNLEEIDVSELILNLKAEMLPIASEKNIDIIVVQTGDLRIQIDEVRIRQALANLVSNAIKFSSDGQAVVVRAFRDGDNMTIAVVDWGVGIPQDELAKVAEPFFRSSSHERIPGTGLGLSIAKQMAELHGGLLRVESELGRGSTFTLILPIRDAAEWAELRAEPDVVS